MLKRVSTCSKFWGCAFLLQEVFIQSISVFKIILKQHFLDPNLYLMWDIQSVLWVNIQPHFQLYLDLKRALFRDHLCVEFGYYPNPTSEQSHMKLEYKLFSFYSFFFFFTRRILTAACADIIHHLSHKSLLVQAFLQQCSRL